jgi:hypothetical protein
MQYQPTLAAFSPLNQHRILQYLTQFASQRYAPATLRAIPLTLTGFVRALPPDRHAVLTVDLTYTTSQDITTFLTAGASLYWRFVDSEVFELKALSLGEGGFAPKIGS